MLVLDLPCDSLSKKSVRKRVEKVIRKAKAAEKEKLEQQSTMSSEKEHEGNVHTVHTDGEEDLDESVVKAMSEEPVYFVIGETGMVLGHSWSDVEDPTRVWKSFAAVLNCSSVDYKNYSSSAGKTEGNYLHVAVSVRFLPPPPRFSFFYASFICRLDS